ncbi:unnamed protein product [Gongylonema pulchrum]|uniref:EF-hand domain-containing protein n=1 Tax=Gongylonema pulchrum TaxID=637853 RepID=A0A3P7MHN0_9BILA|nr:unnamed protein product [Gongylonema pulchrum]
MKEPIDLKYNVDPEVTRQFFEQADADSSGDLSPGELVDFRHEIRRYVTERDSQRAYGNKSGDQEGERGTSEVRKQQLSSATSQKAARTATTQII